MGIEQNELKITSILIHDKESNGYTSYFAEFPEVVAEGNTKEDAIKNLWEALGSMLEFKRDEAAKEGAYDDRISTESFNLAVSR